MFWLHYLKYLHTLQNLAEYLLLFAKCINIQHQASCSFVGALSIVLVHLSCYNKKKKKSQSGQLKKQQKFPLPMLGPRSLRSGRQHGQVRALFQKVYLWLFPHTVERDEGTHRDSLIKASIPFVKAPPSRPKHHSRSQLLILSLESFGFHRKNFGETQTLRPWRRFSGGQFVTLTGRFCKEQQEPGQARLQKWSAEKTWYSLAGFHGAYCAPSKDNKTH